MSKITNKSKSKVSLLQSAGLVRPKKPLSKKKRKVTLFKSGCIIILLCLIGYIFSISVAYNKPDQDLNQNQILTGAQIINEISKSITLPDEAPTNFQIDNPKELAQKNSFFEKANQGDTLIYYPNMQKGILFSNKSKSIIYSGPLNLNQVPK